MVDTQLKPRHRSASKQLLCKLCDKMECFSATYPDDTPPDPASLAKCSAPACYSSSTTVQDITIIQLGCWPENIIPTCFMELHRYTCLCATPLCNDSPPFPVTPSPTIQAWQILLLVLFLLILMLTVIGVKLRNRFKNVDKVSDMNEDNNIICVTGQYQNIVGGSNAQEILLYEGEGDTLEEVIVHGQRQSIQRINLFDQVFGGHSRSPRVQSDDLSTGTYSEIKIENLDQNYNEIGDCLSNQEVRNKDPQNRLFCESSSCESLGYQEVQYIDTGYQEVQYIDTGYQEVQYIDTRKLAENRQIKVSSSFESLGYQEVRYIDTSKLSSQFKNKSEENLRMNCPDNVCHPDENSLSSYEVNFQNSRYIEDESFLLSQSFDYLENVPGTIV